MSYSKLAIATCRVSSTEQLESNSLNRQLESVKATANFLEVTIPEGGLWSGSISSKSGSNYSRHDLKEMLAYCKKNPRVKFLIVDEIDRFMRSIDEMFYFEVLFRKKVGVKVWYAGDPDLNSDNPLAKLRRAVEAFKAEGSNLERQIKSIKGQTAALEQGRYPFSPKPGYKKGYQRGIQEIHDVRGPALRNILLLMASRQVTPSEALVELNKSEFTKGHSTYRMDKFRIITTDPFYAGILEVSKQVKVRNENGLHEPLMTRVQHYELLKIMNDKKKNQGGPRKNGNPKYPLSNIINCDSCLDTTNGRLVGFDHGNGKINSRVYEKYRCRSCGIYVNREDLHSGIERLFNNLVITPKGREELVQALSTVWKLQESQAEQDTSRIKYKLTDIRRVISQQVEAVTDPSNSSVKEEILISIAAKKDELIRLEEQIVKLTNDTHDDKEKFLNFAFDFIGNMGSQFFSISSANRLRCKQLAFPAGLRVDSRKKVYTPEISPLYRLATKKKSTEVLNNTLLVHHS